MSLRHACHSRRISIDLAVAKGDLCHTAARAVRDDDAHGKKLSGRSLWRVEEIEKVEGVIEGSAAVFGTFQLEPD